MACLREKKKAARKSRIQTAAIELFGTYGFNATTMEKVADKAELGVGTLYNYYSSKGDILLSIIKDRSGAFDPDFEAAIKNHASDIPSSVDSFFDIYFRSFSIYNRVIWREFVSNALQGQASLFEYILQIDKIFVENLAKLLACFKSEDKINEGVDIEKAVLTMYSLLMFHIMRYISDEGMSIETLRSSLRDQVMVMIDGLKF